MLFTWRRKPESLETNWTAFDLVFLITDANEQKGVYLYDSEDNYKTTLAFKSQKHYDLHILLFVVTSDRIIQ